jgi:hypothetical protein
MEDFTYEIFMTQNLKYNWPYYAPTPLKTVGPPYSQYTEMLLQYVFYSVDEYYQTKNFID